MAVETVGEMVHGHTFDAMATEWGHRTICMTVVGGTSDYPQLCGRIYDEHAQRPPLSRTALDQEPNAPDRFGFLTAHKFGCGAVTEVSGVCNCGMVDQNVGLLVWLVESWMGKAAEMASWGTPATSSAVMPSTEFRTAYAGIEMPTDVTVNGRIIGRWTPVADHGPSVEPMG
jgi:hypothetical protein